MSVTPLIFLQIVDRCFGFTPDANPALAEAIPEAITYSMSSHWSSRCKSSARGSHPGSNHIFHVIPLVLQMQIQRSRKPSQKQSQYHPSSSLASTPPLLSHRIILKEMGRSSLEVIPFTSSPNPTLLQTWPLVGQQGWDQRPTREESGCRPTVADSLSKSPRSITDIIPSVTS
jgi:hypothetical protein